MGRPWMRAKPVALFAVHRQKRESGTRLAEGHLATPASGNMIRILACRDRFL
jgi:hypothetical protein